ncbi:MAG: hypothetical protein CM1200mP32_03040 [Methanobacteriota archaeon]|nr:MAG: hypothetical protein CM1200mP32_03040 [Euryarchaeota archaeon]
MSTGEVASFDIVLYEDYSGDVLEGISLELVSEDGLGMIHLDSTDSSGGVSADVAPGNWNLELNMTEDRVRWIVDSSNETLFEVSAGGNTALNLTASRMVEFGGNIYWDFDDDNASDVGEGVANVTVNISSNDTNISLLTDQSGDWAVYVPSGTYWHVQTGIEGYSSENRSVSVSTSPNTVDIELTAGSVDVSGHISYIDDEQFATISDGTVMELIPVEGMVRDPVVPDKVLVDGVWMGNWTAQVEPGDWIPPSGSRGGWASGDGPARGRCRNRRFAGPRTHNRRLDTPRHGVAGLRWELPHSGRYGCRGSRYR